MRDIPIENPPNPGASYLQSDFAPIGQAEPFERVAAGPCVELLGSGFYVAPFDKLSAPDAKRLIDALRLPPK